jgi:wyosine [tRNA(Phe)-imidazoG37] synthetase (radical SAM superfamily)
MRSAALLRLADTMRAPAGSPTVCPVFAREDGRVLDLPDALAAVDTGRVGAADPDDFIPMPAGTLLLTLPGRSVCEVRKGLPCAIDGMGGAAIDAVAAALPLGYTRTVLPAFVSRAQAPPLPLYGYAAVVWDGERFLVGAMRTDELESWSPQAHADARVRSMIARRLQEFPGSSLVKQLALCATEYGCYTAQNFFLRAGEAALPVSPACNARCIGCISEQEHDAGIASAQARLRRPPAHEEIVAAAVAHLREAPGAIVSFGQGCEGEPLLAFRRITAAVRDIRGATSTGIIHCNTNASDPQALRTVIAAGVSSIRVSLNSSRPDAYAAYYRPRNYTFDHVRASLAAAGELGATISLNLLTHPGVTDDPAEMESFAELLERNPVAMVQTRTLNVDPERYFEAVGRPRSEPFGMRRWLDWLRARFPAVRIGNFTRGFG